MNTRSIGELFKKQPVLSFAAILSIVLVGFTYYRYTGRADIETDLAAKQADGTRIENNISAGKSLKEQLAAVGAANEQADSRLISSAELATNLGYFYKMEADCGVKLLDLRQAPLPKNAPKSIYMPISYSVAVQGDFKKVMTFLRRVETGEHFCRIVSSSFTTHVGEGTGEASFVTLSLSLDLLGKS